jgi:hypothetical protein
MTQQGNATNLGFDNPTSQEERSRILREERQTNTRAAMTSLLEPALAGRFAATAKADFTIGRDPVVNYPTLPANSPWQQLQPGVEEPTGYEIDFVPAVGEQFEIDRAAAVVSSAVPRLILFLPCGISNPPPLPMHPSPLVRGSWGRTVLPTLILLQLLLGSATLRRAICHLSLWMVRRLFPIQPSLRLPKRPARAGRGGPNFRRLGPSRGGSASAR